MTEERKEQLRNRKIQEISKKFREQHGAGKVLHHPVLGPIQPHNSNVSARSSESMKTTPFDFFVVREQGKIQDCKKAVVLRRHQDVPKISGLFFLLCLFSLFSHRDRHAMER